MKKLFSLCLILALTAPVQAAEWLVSKDTPIDITFKTTAGSDQLKKNDEILVEVARDYVFHNVTVFQKGTQGIAVIEKADKATIMGMPGRIIIKKLIIGDAFGHPHEFKIDYKNKGRQNTVASFGSYFFLAAAWPLAPFFMAGKGKDAQIPEGKIFQIKLVEAFPIQSDDEALPPVMPIAKEDELADLIKSLESQSEDEKK